MNSIPDFDNVIPFTTAAFRSAGSPYEVADRKIIMRSGGTGSVEEAYGIELLRSERLRSGQRELSFSVTLKNDRPGQSLLCGLVTADYRKGVAIAIDPASGAIIDRLYGTGPIGYLSHATLLPEKPVRVELKIQRFGKNHLTSVRVEGEGLMYPAFVASADLVFSAVVGGDVASGSKVSYREVELTAGRLARVA